MRRAAATRKPATGPRPFNPRILWRLAGVAAVIFLTVWLMHERVYPPHAQDLGAYRDLHTTALRFASADSIQDLTAKYEVLCHAPFTRGPLTGADAARMLPTTWIPKGLWGWLGRNAAIQGSVTVAYHTCQDTWQFVYLQQPFPSLDGSGIDARTLVLLITSTGR